MIKARSSTDDGRTFILLGLSSENCRRLLEGQPIRIDTQLEPPEGLGLNGGPVIALVGGATEETIAAELKAFALLKELH